jgi:hypothetical protein
MKDLTYPAARDPAYPVNIKLIVDLILTRYAGSQAAGYAGFFQAPAFDLNHLVKKS